MKLLIGIVGGIGVLWGLNLISESDTWDFMDINKTGEEKRQILFFAFTIIAIALPMLYYAFK